MAARAAKPRRSGEERPPVTFVSEPSGAISSSLRLCAKHAKRAVLSTLAMVEHCGASEGLQVHPLRFLESHRASPLAALV